MVQLIKNKQLLVTTPFDVNSQRLINVANPSGSTDAVNKNFVDSTAINQALCTGLYSGGTITLSGTSGIYLATNTLIVDHPYSRIKVYVNSLEVEVGDAVKTKDCFFSSDGGTTAKAWNGVAIGDSLYWNGGTAPYNLEASDIISYEYLTR